MRRALALLCTLLLTGCPEPVEMEQVTTRPNDALVGDSVTVGEAWEVETKQFHDGWDTGTWDPCDGTVTSSAPNYLSVTRAGDAWLLVAVREGTATVTADCGGTTASVTYLIGPPL